MKTRRGSSSSVAENAPSFRRRVRPTKPDPIEDPINEEASEGADEADSVDEVDDEIEHPVEQVAPNLDQTELGDSEQVIGSSNHL